LASVAVLDLLLPLLLLVVTPGVLRRRLVALGRVASDIPNKHTERGLEAS